MTLKEDGRSSNKDKKRHGRIVKCDICKQKLDIDEERELGNVVTEMGVTVLYCDCGNQIIIK